MLNIFELCQQSTVHRTASRLNVSRESTLAMYSRTRVLGGRHLPTDFTAKAVFATFLVLEHRGGHVAHWGSDRLLEHL
jgi:hypothetical protein